MADTLHQAGLGTVLLDLTHRRGGTARPVRRRAASDIPLLAGRLAATVDWLADRPSTSRNPLGLFGASTGAAAALVATAERPAGLTG